MATLYIANTSKQVSVVTFRFPEEIRPREVSIFPGTQKQLGNFEQPQIDIVVKQMSRYGMRSVDELQRNRNFVGLLYSINSPVPLDAERIIEDTFRKNDEILDAQAEERRENVAAAVASHITNAMHEHGVPVPRAEVEMVEDTRGTPTLSKGYEAVAPGVRSRHESQPAKRVRKGQR